MNNFFREPSADFSDFRRQGRELTSSSVGLECIQDCRDGIVVSLLQGSENAYQHRLRLGPSSLPFLSLFFLAITVCRI
jgi:hypothetical protein